jgi:predicted nuclease of predicted toxin-antitoxin system
VKLFLDENISPKHATELRAEGHDVLAVLDVSLSGATDERIRQFSIETGRILVTLDADFANVIRFPPRKTPGVVRLRIQTPTETAIREALQRVLLLLQNTDLSGRLAVVDPQKIRIRQ